MTHKDDPNLSFGVPDFHQVTGDMIREALQKGWQDFKRSYQFGLFFGGFYTLCG